MSIRVAIELPDWGIKDVDLSNIQNGNPGIGGSEYLFLLLAVSLKKYAGNKFDVVIYHYNKNRLPRSLDDVIVKDEMKLLDVLSKEKIDIFIHQLGKNQSWYNYLSEKRIKSIAWAHVYLSYEEMKCITACECEKRVVFVGKEEYDAYIDEDIINKSVWIYNMINTDNHKVRKDNYSKEITYMGSLVPAKGFHVLASIWPEIIKKVPNAKLNVIGTGKLYDRNAQLGKYNIAEKLYEDSFMKYLTDESGKILPSVKFWGLLGNEKEEIFAKSAVGVVNPTAITETFCMSAIEMQICGLVVVSKKKWGLLDTIKDGKTGFLFSSKQEFINSIIKLLNDKNLNDTMGNNAINFVKENFSIEKIIEKWIETLEGVYFDNKVIFEKPKNNYLNDYKWVKLIIRFIRIKCHMKIFPSFETLKGFLRKLLKR